jgi:ADP-heptose:LPS heptosyltransferase
MHVLLVRFSSLGDVVLQTATVNFLKSLYGDKLRVTFVTSSEFVSLLNEHPFIDDVVSFNRRGGENWKQFRKKIQNIHQQNKIDFIFDLHGTLRSSRLRLSFWFIPSISMDKRRVERFFLTKLKIPWIKKIFGSKFFGLEPQVIRTIRDFSTLLGTDLGVWKTQELIKSKNQTLTSLAKRERSLLNDPYVVIAPSASFVSKRWPIEYFVELVKLILSKTDFHIVVLAGPEDHFCSAFNQITDNRFLNLQGKTSLRESMNYIAGAGFCLGNDSGMNHIAEAYDVPCLTIFGPTDPLFGFAPHGKRSRFIYKNLWCSPCSTTGKKACFRKMPYCMTSILPSEVMNSFEEMIKEI